MKVGELGFRRGLGFHKVYNLDECELAWPNGPLRAKGSGCGAPSSYVCERCMKPRPVYRCVGATAQRQQMWLCATCGRRKENPWRKNETPA